MPPVTASALKDMVSARINNTLSTIQNSHTKTGDVLSAEIQAWVASVDSSLDTILTTAASAGRTFYIVESPVFINPGKKSTGEDTHNDKSLKYEHVFREYLKSLWDISFTVDSGITVTEVVRNPHTFSSPLPALPQNVVLRYKFSW